MSLHLSAEEFDLILQKNPQSLQTNRYLHFEKCTSCKDEYKQQQQTHLLLNKISPLSAPGIISQAVLKNLSKISDSVKPKSKTDWSFLLSILVLFAISSWILFSGRLASYLGEYAPDFMKEENSLIRTEEIVKTISTHIPAFSLDFSWLSIKWGSLYLYIGMIVAILYIFIDYKLSRRYKFRRS